MPQKVKPVPAVAVIEVQPAAAPPPPVLGATQPSLMPIEPPNFDPFSVSPALDPALTMRQSDAINRKAAYRE